MVMDQQVRTLWDWLGKEASLGFAAAKAGMDRKTARKYRSATRLPSQMSEQAPARTWRTREDPFADVWSEVEALLKEGPGWEAKTLFEELQRRYPDRFAEGQLRTLQRRVKQWQATCGPDKEVFFAQHHVPGRLGASDFTHMTELGVTINGGPFAHLVYHFVLTHSNWEHVTVCFSESFESFCDGFQNAVWTLGGVPEEHRSDRMSLAVQASGSQFFTRRYEAVMAHYGVRPQAINAGKGHENGDVEQSHHRFKRVVDQALLLRGSRDFASREAYEAFLHGLCVKRNAKRKERFEQEKKSRRAGTAASPAALGIVSAALAARAVGQHDRGGPEHLLGASPPDRRMGGGADLRRCDRSVVRPTKGGRVAAFAGPAQAPHQLSARHRVVGAQAGGVCRVSLSGGVVPDEPISHGLRLFGGDGVGAVCPGIPGDFAPGGATQRGGSGRGFAAFARRRRRGPGGGGGVGARRTGAGAADGGARRTHQPIYIRRFVREQGGVA
jgi:transposase